MEEATSVPVYRVRRPKWEMTIRSAIEYFHNHPAHLLEPDLLCNTYKIQPGGTPCFGNSQGAWLSVDGSSTKGPVHLICVAGTITIFAHDDASEPVANRNMSEDYLHTSLVTTRMNPGMRGGCMPESPHVSTCVLTTGQYIRIRRDRWYFYKVERMTSKVNVFSMVTFVEKFSPTDDPGPLTIYTRQAGNSPQERLQGYTSGEYRIPSLKHGSIEVLLNDYWEVHRDAHRPPAQ